MRERVQLEASIYREELRRLNYLRNAERLGPLRIDWMVVQQFPPTARRF